MFDIWYEMPTWLRAVVGLLMLLVGIGLVLIGTGRFGLAIAATGFVLMLFSGAGNDSNGYNF